MKNNSTFPEFIEICKKTEKELKVFLEGELKKYYTEVINANGFLYAKANNCPVLLTAHMDTVHKETIKDYYEDISCGQHMISSPQGIGGDDRCGIYMILRILKETDMRPAVLFCEQEEIGGVGSNKFCTTEYLEDIKKLKFCIELDRANAKDLVFYDDDNEEFQDFCEKVTGYKTAWGSFSDISHICPDAGVSGVNISCGYYRAHTVQEYVIMEEMIESISKVKELMQEANKEETEQFEFVQTPYKGYLWGRYDAYDDYYNHNYSYYGGYYGNYNKSKAPVKMNPGYELYIQFVEEGVHKEDCIDGVSESDCWLTFFMDHASVCFNDVLDWEGYDI